MSLAADEVLAGLAEVEARAEAYVDCSALSTAIPVSLMFDLDPSPIRTFSSELAKSR